MAQTLKPLPRHNPRKQKSALPGQLIVASMLLVFSLTPRLWILGFWIFGSQLGDAFSSWIMPAVGFFILPWATLLYAWMWAISSSGVTGWEWLLVAAGFLLDMSFWAAARRVFQT